MSIKPGQLPYEPIKLTPDKCTFTLKTCPLMTKPDFFLTRLKDSSSARLALLCKESLKPNTAETWVDPDNKYPLKKPSLIV